MPTLRVAIAGATGYTGEELLRLLLQHPHVKLTCLAASAKWDKPVPASDVFPRLGRIVPGAVEALDLARLVNESDCVFLALPHGASADLAPELVERGKKVIDLSGDFRLHDPALYPRWYKYNHPHPEWLNGQRAVYGLTEFHRDAIRSANFVSNPGCYATSILLAVLPLLKAGLVQGDRFIVDAKSGLSGAGRKPETALLFSEMSENLRAYKVNDHQHMPEILQEIQQVTGKPAKMVFTPQVIPVHRGMLSMVYVGTSADANKIKAAYDAAYPADRTPFVRMRSTLPQIKDVAWTNYCDLGFSYHADAQCLTVVSAIDNLTKGAAGQAIQNFNLMHGFPETTGLL